MRKKDLMYDLWVVLSSSYHDAKVELMEAIRKAEDASAGVTLLNQYLDVNLDMLRSLGFATDEQLKRAFNALIESLESLSYVKMPLIDDRVQAFLKGKARRPFV